MGTSFPNPPNQCGHSRPLPVRNMGTEFTSPFSQASDPMPPDIMDVLTINPFSQARHHDAKSSSNLGGSIIPSDQGFDPLLSGGMTSINQFSQAASQHPETSNMASSLINPLGAEPSPLAPGGKMDIVSSMPAGQRPLAVWPPPPLSVNDWEKHRRVISEIYRSKNCTLKQLMTTMEEQYGVRASRNHYLDCLKEWGLEKNIKAKEYEAMILHWTWRAARGRRTVFKLRDRVVSKAKIDRYIKRTAWNKRETFPTDLPSLTEMEIECLTPPRVLSPGPTKDKDFASSQEATLSTWSNTQGDGNANVVLIDGRDALGTRSVVVHQGAGALAICSPSLAPQQPVRLPDRMEFDEALARPIQLFLDWTIENPHRERELYGHWAIPWKIYHGMAMNRINPSAEGVKLIRYGLADLDRDLQRVQNSFPVEIIFDLLHLSLLKRKSPARLYNAVFDGIRSSLLRCYGSESHPLAKITSHLSDATFPHQQSTESLWRAVQYLSDNVQARLAGRSVRYAAFVCYVRYVVIAIGLSSGVFDEQTGVEMVDALRDCVESLVGRV